MVTLDNSKLPTHSFACGPAQSLDALRNVSLAQTRFERSHRAPDVVHEIYRHATQQLRRLLNIPAEYAICFFPGGANAAMDAVLWNLVQDTLSGVAFGEFSNRWAQDMAARLPHITNHVRFAQPGEFFPQEEPSSHASLIILTPNETSTGVQIPNEYLTRMWSNRGPNTLVAWDATSCAGGRLLPPADYDVMLFSLQKCFGIMGGTCVLVLSPHAQARLQKPARPVPYALDLQRATEQAQVFQTVNTPNTTAIWMCGQVAQWMNEHGGINAMDRLCRQHAQHVIDWAKQTDFVRPLVEDENWRSYTTLTLQLTDPRLRAEDIHQALVNSGLENLKDGIKRHPYAPENSLRVACFPLVDTDGIEQYKKLTAALDEIVRQLKSSFK